MAFCTYIVSSGRNGTLYVGSTDDIERRIGEHKHKVRAGFTSRYGVDRLVWYEVHGSREAAFVRERQIKKWNRQWKLALIERQNPGWMDLFDQWFSI